MEIIDTVTGSAIDLTSQLQELTYISIANGFALCVIAGLLISFIITRYFK